MSERSILIPDQKIIVPEPMAELFDVLGVILDPETPIRKQTSCFVGQDFPALCRTNQDPLMGILNVDFVGNVSKLEAVGKVYYNSGPVFEEDETERPSAVHATQVLEGTRHKRIEDGSGTIWKRAYVGFAESHAVNQDKNRHIWELDVKLNDASKSFEFAANSRGEFAYRNGRELGTEWDNDRIIEIARETGRILLPEDYHPLLVQ